MDCCKIGTLIQQIRKEKELTQKEVANQLNISDKTVSKWERGIGCPDVTLLNKLSDVLDVNVEQLLSGQLDKKDTDGGNMKKIKFYVCKNCGNIITATSEADISCCGRRLTFIKASVLDESHKTNIRDMGSEFYIQIDHPMSKEHYISFVAFVGFDKVLINKLYPEQNSELYIPKMQKGQLYIYCSKEGLFVEKMPQA